MRVVDEHAEVLSQVDGFQPATHSVEPCQPPSERLQWHAQRQAYSRSAERVVHIESRGHRKPHIGFANGSPEPKTRPGAGHRQVQWIEVRCSGHSIGPATGYRSTAQLLVTGVVAVEHGGFLDPF